MGIFALMRIGKFEIKIKYIMSVFHVKHTHENQKDI